MSTGTAPPVVLGTRWTEYSHPQSRPTRFWGRRTETLVLPPQRFLDWTIDGQLLRDRRPVSDDSARDAVTFLREGSRGDRFAIASLRALLRAEDSHADPRVQYADGRAGLLFCPQCGGLDCGAVSTDVRIGTTFVEWRDIGYQIDVPGGVAERGVPWFTLRFDRAQYEDTVRGVLAEWAEDSAPGAE